MSRALVVFCLLGWMAPCGWASPTQWIRPDGEWRFLALTTNPPAAWPSPAFDDASWEPAVAGFSVGFVGYAQGATVIPWQSGGAVVGGLAMRRQFVVEDPTAAGSLLLRVEFEDGMLVWLNGVEVLRIGLPAGDVPRWDATAASHPSGLAESYDLSDRLALVHPGTNVLAIQVFEASPWGATLYAWPELRVNFARGPVVQNVSGNSAFVVWHTQVPWPARVEFRRVSEDAWRVVRPEKVAPEQAVEISGLAPGERYEYRVVLEGPGPERASDAAIFATLRPAGDVDFLVIGDTGATSAGQYELATALFRERTDLVLHVGDVVYPSNLRGRIDLRCFSVYEPSFRSVPWFFTFGNHDVYGGKQSYLESFLLPKDRLTGASDFYSFDHGDAHFVSLFVPWWGFSGLGAVGAGGSRGAQYHWLTNDLATTDKPWKVVFFHQPPHTSGPHSGDDYDLDGARDVVALQTELLPVLTHYGVQVVFNGHDHDWERFAPVDGLHCVVTGGGGAFLYTQVNPDPLSVQFVSRFHFTRVKIRGPRMDVEAVGSDGEVFDRFTIGAFAVSVRNTAAGLQLSWTARIGRRYIVESADRLPGVFVPLAMEVPTPRASSTNARVILPIVGSAGWFRVREEP